MKMNLDFVKPTEIEVCGQKINVKPYLTSGEMRAIIDEMLVNEDLVTRNNVKDIMILRFCTNIEVFDNDEISDDLIDLYRVNGIIEKVYDVIDEKYIIDIDYYVNMYESTSNYMKLIRNDISILLKEVNGSINNLSNENFTKEFADKIEELKEVVDK